MDWLRPLARLAVPQSWHGKDGSMCLGGTGAWRPLLRVDPKDRRLDALDGPEWRVASLVKRRVGGRTSQRPSAAH